MVLKDTIYSFLENSGSIRNLAFRLAVLNIEALSFITPEGKKVINALPDIHHGVPLQDLVWTFDLEQFAEWNQSEDEWIDLFEYHFQDFKRQIQVSTFPK